MTYRNDGITRRAHYNIMFCSRTIDVCTRAPVDAVTVWRLPFCSVLLVLHALHLVRTKNSRHERESDRAQTKKSHGEKSSRWKSLEKKKKWKREKTVSYHITGNIFRQTIVSTYTYHFESYMLQCRGLFRWEYCVDAWRCVQDNREEL